MGAKQGGESRDAQPQSRMLPRRPFLEGSPLPCWAQAGSVKCEGSALTMRPELETPWHRSTPSLPPRADALGGR